MWFHIAAGTGFSFLRWIGLMSNELRTARAAFLLVLAAAGVSLACHGQESLRLSLAGAEAAEARRQAAGALDYYNLKVGPSAWRFSAGLGVQASDNLRGDANNPQEDVIFRPELDARMRLPVSEVNTLSLSVGGGYAAYAHHSEYDRPFITPGSELSFDIYAGDFWINLHDRFAIEEQGYLDPTVTGIGNYERLDNAAGVAATWDLNKVVAKLGYDHMTYASLGGHLGQTDGESEVFSGSAGYLWKPGLRTGLEVGGSFLHYSAVGTGSQFSDGTEWSAGPFCEAQLTDHIKGRASAGYTSFRPESGVAAQLGQEFSGVYAQLGATHRLNQYVEYTLSGGRMLNFGFFGGLLDQYFARLNANWHVFRKTGIATTLDYQHGSQLGFGAETFDWFGPGISVSRLLTAKLTGSLGYQFYWRSSDLPGRDYSANVATGSLIYRF
jgi:hypothetical protein